MIKKYTFEKCRFAPTKIIPAVLKAAKRRVNKDRIARNGDTVIVTIPANTVNTVRLPDSRLESLFKAQCFRVEVE